MKNGRDDKELVKAAISGDEDACAELVRRHQDMVFRLAARITRRPELVEDVAQEVFIKAFKGLARFRRQSSFSTWLYRITVNKSIECMRRESARDSAMERASQDRAAFPDSVILCDSMSGERMVLRREVQAKVRDALGALSPEARALLALRYMEELSTPEIAEVLELPEGTVRSRLYYTRLELAKVLAPVLELPGATAREEKK